MKALKIIALALIVAMLGVTLASCSAAKIKDEAAQNAFNLLLNDINDTNAVTINLDLDSVEITDLEYISFTAVDDTTNEEFPMYSFKFNVSYRMQESGYINGVYYMNVIYKNDSLSAKKGTDVLYEKYQKTYKCKDGNYKEKDINKMLAVAVENLKTTVAARKAEAERQAEQARIAKEEMAAFSLIADAYVTAINGATLTAETTKEQLIALFPAESDTLAYVGEEVLDGDQELTEGVTYVLVPTRPSAGYLTFDLTIYNTKYTMMVCVLNGEAEKSGVNAR